VGETLALVMVPERPITLTVQSEVVPTRVTSREQVGAGTEATGRDWQTGDVPPGPSTLALKVRF
jgi:hypothetical protein